MLIVDSFSVKEDKLYKFTFSAIIINNKNNNKI